MNGSVKPSGKAEMLVTDLVSKETAPVDAFFSPDGTFTGTVAFKSGARAVSGKFSYVSRYVVRSQMRVGGEVWATELEKNGQGSDGEGTIDPR